MRQVKKAVITAAGFGSRFLPVVKSTPKEMLPIINKPIIQYVVEECVDAGLEEIIIVVRKGNEVIRNYFYEQVPHMEKLLADQGKSERFEDVLRVLNMGNITIIDQDPDLPYGNGSPVISARHLLTEGEPFAALFADDLVLTKTRSALSQLKEYYEQSGADAVMGVQYVPDKELDRYGIVDPVEGSQDETSGQIRRIIEKPDPKDAKTNFAQYGRFIIPFEIFEHLKPDATGKDNEVWLTDANDRLAERMNYRYKQIEDGTWYTTGDPARYFEAQVRYMMASEEYGKATREIVKSASE
ncbi:MAG: UTP--glucose-1-phosphate uridylyltransferase [candidate division WS6 bacterium OLB20]|uniref:UTP--glucose-1-phosphate uridylyltransferase n=1 Tax=candidate division WS6 bacterium OLB20 TaxID=1617426 RepID=A0A136LXP8_9BACT|nr:MAG: UTP--glucose-1-phosphate uridylyltransferase [candidate division WS6 bacterium OLB20]